jgi:hypothetical protein
LFRFGVTAGSVLLLVAACSGSDASGGGSKDASTETGSGGSGGSSGGAGGAGTGGTGGSGAQGGTGGSAGEAGAAGGAGGSQDAGADGSDDDAGPDAGDSGNADANDGAPDAAPREVVTMTVPLNAGEIAEGILIGGPSDRADIQLDAPVTELDWNVHGHVDGGAQVVNEGLNQMSVDYEFVPPSQGDWHLLIRNSGPTSMDVEVRIELYGAMSWDGLQ